MNQEDNTQITGNILIIKGRLKSISNNLFGQFIIQFNNKNNIDMFNAIISTFSDLYDSLEPHNEWTKYQESIANIKWQGKFNSSMTASIMEQIKDFSNTQDATELYNQTVNYDYDNLDLSFFDLFNRIIHDKNLVIETGIEEITTEDLKNLENNNDEDIENNNTDEASNDDGSVMLSCKAILAPVKGKPIYELRIGNVIMVRILPGPDKNNYYIDLLDLKEDNIIKPVPGTVVDIKAGSGKKDPIEIILEISPGVFGKCIEEEQQVKLKMYDPNTDGPLHSESGDIAATQTKQINADAPSKPKGTLLMLLIFVFILLLFITIIISIW